MQLPPKRKLMDVVLLVVLESVGLGVVLGL